MARCHVFAPTKQVQMVRYKDYVTLSEIQYNW